MKWILTACNKGNPASKWTEDYNHDEVVSNADAEAMGKAFIERFNSTLRPHEKEREFISAEISEESTADLKHNWSKTNAFTISDRTGNYDKMQCKQCGITGKRFGISSTVTRDNNFKARGFEFCDTAKVLLEKRKAKAAKENGTVHSRTS